MVPGQIRRCDPQQVPEYWCLSPLCDDDFAFIVLMFVDTGYYLAFCKLELDAFGSSRYFVIRLFKFYYQDYGLAALKIANTKYGHCFSQVIIHVSPYYHPDCSLV